MKSLLALVCVSSLYGAPSDGIDELREVSVLDLSAIEQPAMPQEMQSPVPIFQPRHKSPFLAVGLSSLLPGLGHVYLGDMKTAGGLIGSAGLGIGLVSFAHSEHALLTSLVAVQSTWSYGLYAAYRDVRTYNGQGGYRYKMPTDSLADLTLASFEWSVLKKPEVWGGFLGALGLAVSTTYLIHPKEARIHSNLSSKMQMSPLIALPVGIGEESLFRGYLQSQLSEVFTPWGGIVLSSLAFGAMHIPNALLLEPEDRRGYYTVSIPFITMFGSYLGWLTYKNHSLKESVALHTWYDFLLFAAGSLANRAAVTGRTEFAVAIPF